MAEVLGTKNADVAKMLYVDTRLGCLLLKADKMTMPNSFEPRVPFLDHKSSGICGLSAR